MVMLMSPLTLATAYPHLSKYRALIRKHDPTGKFSNAFIRRLVFGVSTPAEEAADDAHVSSEKLRASWRES